MAKFMFILGASDPEMAEIDRLLSDSGCSIGFAARDGVRVHPGNAYEANGIIGRDSGLGPMPEFDSTIVAVECGGDFGLWPVYRTDRVLDHHKAGDAGYGVPPERFIEGSSIGQLVKLLAAVDLLRLKPHTSIAPLTAIVGDRRVVAGELIYDEERDESHGPHRVFGQGYWWVCIGRICGVSIGAQLPMRIVLTAASDHCPAAAYQGNCPGVDPGKLMWWRAQTRADYQGLDIDVLLEQIDAAIKTLKEAPFVDIGPTLVRDMRGPFVPELPEAALRTGEVYLAGPIPCPDGRSKLVIGGAGEKSVVGSAVVQAWLDGEYRAFGTEKPYGDPVRGFAGAYVVADSMLADSTPIDNDDNAQPSP